MRAMVRSIGVECGLGKKQSSQPGKGSTFGKEGRDEAAGTNGTCMQPKAWLKWVLSAKFEYSGEGVIAMLTVCILIILEGICAFWVFLHNLPIVSVVISLINHPTAQELPVLSSLNYMAIFKNGPSYYPMWEML